MGGPAMISINNNLNWAISVTNTAPFNIYIQRGAIIRLVETEDLNNNITPLSSENVKAIIDSIAPVKVTSENLSRADIENKENLTVPNKYKSKYIDILFKHRSAISIGKLDLRHAKNFHHKIHRKDNCPVYRKQFIIPDSHHDFLTK